MITLLYLFDFGNDERLVHVLHCSYTVCSIEIKPR